MIATLFPAARRTTHGVRQAGRRRSPVLRLAGALAGAACLLAVTAASASAETTGCRFASDTHVLTVTAAGAPLRLSVSAGTIVVHDAAGHRIPCGGAAATVLSTRTIVLLGTGLGTSSGDGWGTKVTADRYTLDMSGGRFAPGYAGGEAAGSTPEIEFVTRLGGGADRVRIVGTAANDRLAAAADGLRMNADADADVTWASGADMPEEVELAGGGGADLLDATSPATAVHVDLVGGAGNDMLFPSPAVGEIVDGGLDWDTVRYDLRGATTAVWITLDDAVANDGYLGEADRVLGMEHVVGTGASDVLVGGAGDDSLEGAGGNDTITGGDGDDFIGGGAGADRVWGDGGSDDIRMADGVRDVVDGGAGTDQAQCDGGLDVTTGIEVAF